MKILLIGPPGVGKGTQSKLICDFFKIKHISTGDILRKHIYDSTHMGSIISKFDIDKGNFVPDKLVNDLIYEMNENNMLASSYLLDGYPRTINQAVFCTENILKDSKYIVIYLNSSRENILNRILKRRICQKCGKVYSLKDFDEKLSKVCDDCGGGLVQRPDDTKDVFNNRLSIYYKITSDIIEYFRDLNVLYDVEASGEIVDIFNNIRNIIGEYYDLHKE